MTPHSPSDLAACIDHTLLSPLATPADIERLCAEAIEHGFHAVCVNGAFVAQAAARLEDSPVEVACTIAFPLGAAASGTKVDEVRRAVADGASELDVVAFLGALRAGDDAAFVADLERVVARARPEGARVKAILETGALTEDEARRGARLARDAGVDFVKTSTGFGHGGATVEAVRLLRDAVGPELGVKASGGIRTAGDARALLDAGATRLGCSASIAIVSGEPDAGA